MAQDVIIVTEATEDDHRRGRELIEKHGWDDLLDAEAELEFDGTPTDDDARLAEELIEKYGLEHMRKKK